MIDSTPTPLFHPYDVNLKGILKCRICGELFLKASLVRKVGKHLHGLPPFPGEQDGQQETIRRRKHAREHVARGEALLTREGRFVLTPAANSSYKPAPTAFDYGFKKETA